MKRIPTCILTLLMLFSLTAPAFADIMWEPDDNTFFEKHRRDCAYENRSYYANGKDGFITLLDAPDGGMVRAQYENGEVLWVGYTYRDWALVSRWEDGNSFSGWMPMADLTLVYDYLCFAEEYADQITEYNGEFADYNGGAKVFNFYEYPGAAEIKHSFEASGDMGWDIVGNLTGAHRNSSYISSIFVNGDGRTWGFVNYMYGYRNGWFCLDEPDGERFPPREIPAVELTPAQEPSLPAASYLPYGLVAAVIAITAGLLVFFYGKRGKSTD